MDTIGGDGSKTSYEGERETSRRPVSVPVSPQTTDYRQNEENNNIIIYIRMYVCMYVYIYIYIYI